MLVQLERYAEAAKIYEQLLKRNADNVEFYKMLERCRGLPSGAPERPTWNFDFLTR